MPKTHVAQTATPTSMTATAAAAAGIELHDVRFVKLNLTRVQHYAQTICVGGKADSKKRCFDCPLRLHSGLD